LSTYAGYTLMGSKPAAGRARALAPCAGRSAATSVNEWHLSIDPQATKPATRMFTVPDNGHRRLKRSP